MVWVKICGVRNVENARQIAACQPDAIGLNFYARSSRVVDPETARAIVDILPIKMEAVGVFVNSTAQEILEIVRHCDLDCVQLHGDEPPEVLVELYQRMPSLPPIRAWRFGAEGLEPLAEYLERCRVLGVPIFALLLDAGVSGAYGGTGSRLSWEDVQRACAPLTLPPVILAGGLTPGNVAAAIQTVSPWGVDVASGVESSPGLKDPLAVAKFIRAARAVTKTSHT